MYTLYYMPGACSMAIHVLLNELGQQVKLVNVGDPKGGRERTPEFLKINPRGNVPVLDDDGFVVREGAAIILYLLEKHKSPMLPASGKERAQAIEWLMYCNATLHPAFGKAFFAKGFTGETGEKVLDAAIEQINKVWKDIDTRLAKSPYLAGDTLTAADILMTVIANWTSYFTKPITLGDNVKKHVRKIIALPSYQKALTEEKVEYKAAA